MNARILFVDDEKDLEPLILQKFRRLLRSGEIELEFACDGLAALECLSASDFDLIISDINMPRMDGLKLLEKLQAGEGDVPTVILSAYGDMSNIRTAMNRGAFDFLLKPIDFEDLEVTINKTLGHVRFLRETREKQAAAESALATLSRYFSPNLADRLADPDNAISLAGQRRDIAVLFTDIEGFTSLAESLEPDMLTQLLNAYLAGVADIIFEFEGTLAKIVGDAMHILFGAPGEQADHAHRAVECALVIDAFCEGFRRDWQARNVTIGATRIGVHSGPAIVGNFGGSRFFDYTAYGDTVNIAARLEAANKLTGTRICVSETAAQSAGNFQGRPIGDLVLRGRGQPIRAFEPLGDQSAEQFAAYCEAFANLESADPKAVSAFAALVSAYPEDRLSSFHLKRLLNNETGTTIKVG
jgi:adenylate cyclase